jgi:hypothetical protein
LYIYTAIGINAGVYVKIYKTGKFKKNGKYFQRSNSIQILSGIFILGNAVSRSFHGVPENWPTIKNWITNENRTIIADSPQKQNFSIKCPEISELKCYKKPPNNTFWNSFPKNTKKNACYTPINVEKLSLLVNENSSKWSYNKKL